MTSIIRPPAFGGFRRRKWEQSISGKYGCIYYDGETNGNTASGALQTLDSFTLLGGFLRSNGQALTINVFGTYATTGLHSTDLKIGSTTLIHDAAFVAVSGDFSWRVLLIALGRTGIRAVTEMFQGNSGGAGTYAVSSVTDTAFDLTVKNDITFTTTVSSALANEVVVKSFRIEHSPAP